MLLLGNTLYTWSSVKGFVVELTSDFIANAPEYYETFPYRIGIEVWIEKFT